MQNAQINTKMQNTKCKTQNARRECKTQNAKQPMQDFLILGPSDHGVRGLITLQGIESPGVTSSLAIGDYVASMIELQS